MSDLPSPTIAVRGSWTAEVPPELARVRITVGARSGDRTEVLRDLARRLDEVRAEVAGYRDAVESRTPVRCGCARS